MKRATAIAALCGAGLLATAAAPAGAIGLGQIDTFQNNTTQSWMNGQNPDPQILTGGPAGASDLYMRITSDGSGSGGKLTVFNDDQWLGDYIGAGVDSVEMDLRNFGTTTLTMRFAIREAPGFGQPGYCTNGFSLPADGIWHHAVFSLASGNMIAVGATTMTLNQLLHQAGEIRILHATSPSVTGTNVTGSVGIDNIHAIPSPGPIALFALGSVVILGPRRGRRQASE